MYYTCHQIIDCRRINMILVPMTVQLQKWAENTYLQVSCGFITHMKKIRRSMERKQNSPLFFSSSLPLLQQKKTRGKGKTPSFDSTRSKHVSRTVQAAYSQLGNCLQMEFYAQVGSIRGGMLLFLFSARNDSGRSKHGPSRFCFFAPRALPHYHF